jgi:PKD repeat protein
MAKPSAHVTPAAPHIGAAVRTRGARVLLLALALTALAIQHTSAGALSSVSPSGATAGVTLTIIGTGFNTTAGNNLVTFTPSSGAPLTASAKTVTTVDAATGVRRVTVVVPDGLAIGTTGLTVTNTTTGEVSQGASFELIALTISGTTTASPGSTGIQVGVQGSPNAAFIAGNTKVSLGAGVTLTALTIDSATTLHATLSIAASAALGTRALSVSTSTQTLGLLNAFTVANGPVNRAPIVSAGTAATITLPAGASLGGTVTDDGLPAGAAVTSAWTKASGPGNVSFGNASSPTTTATFDQAGTYVLRLTANDSQFSAFSEVTITVNPAVVTPPTNVAPIVNAGTAATITLPAGAPLNGTVTDDGLPTGAAVTSTWSKFSGPGNVTFTNASSPVTTATFSQPGTYVLRLTASDTQLSTSSDVTITVNPPAPTNVAPTVSAGTAATITLPTGASLSGSVTDDGLPTGATVTSTWSKFSGPGNVTFANAASPVTTATFDQAGSYVLRLTATDTQLSAFSEVTITVNPPAPTNVAPTVSAGTAATITLPTGASLSGSVTDDGLPTGATVTSTWSKFSGPGNVTFANAASPVTTATFDQAGTYVLRLTATDTLLTAFSEVTITVNPPVVTPPTNVAPTVSAGTAATITLPAGASLSGSVTDDGLPTGATVTSTWTKFSGPGNVTFVNANNAVTTATFDQAGTYVLRLTATDTLLTAFSEVTITANPPIVTPPTNVAPTVSAGTAATITLPAGASLGGSVTDDGLPTGAAVASTWSKFSGPGNVTFASAANPVTTATFDQAGTYVLRLTATDTLLSAFSDVTITVNPPIVTPPGNSPPTAAANGPYSGTIGVPVSFNGSGSDPDSQALIFSWNFGDGSTASGATASHTYAAANTYTATLTVSDGQLSATASTTVQIASVAQTNHPPTAQVNGPQAGETGIGVSFDGSASTDPDNDTLSYAWSFGDGSNGAGQKPVHVFASAGSFTVTLTVTDSHGATAVATTSATITAAADRSPPIITLAGPKEALPGAHVTIVADASDNIGVTSVTLDLNGADPIEISTPPYQRAIIVPDFVAPGTSYKVGATARDAAGNTSAASVTLTVVAEPDTVKPQVTMKAPSQAAPGTLLQLSATASDNAGVASVILSANGVTLATLTAAPYEAPYLVPAGTPVGSAITFSAQAIDTSDNRAVSSAVMSVVQAPDTTPPTVGLDAPGTATAGTTFTATATAADDTGVASVAFLLDGTRIATVSDPPYRTTISVPSTLQSGAHLHIEARAADFSGLEGIASRDVNIVAPAAGVVTGEVYDDGSGLAIAGAGVALLGTDGRGLPYTQTTVTDARGRYSMDAAEGSGIVQVTMPGWSSANRAIAISPNKGVTVVDARLTPTAVGTAIDALPGGFVVGDRVTFLKTWQREVSASEDPTIGQPALGGPDVVLTIPPGALASSATLTLTPLSRQSLPGLLPTGWTPLAIVDIGPHGVPLSTGATISSPNPLNVKAGTPVVFAQWDEQVRGWRAVASTILPQDKGALSGTVAATGQYAWAAADVLPLAPPQPAAGDLLAGVTAVLIPGDASAVVNPQPKILFYKPGVKSDVRGTVATAAPLASGTIVKSRITESYQFRSAGEIHPDPTEQDLVLYQIPGGPVPVMAAGFPVSPSLTFEALSLNTGVITVELRAPEEAVHEVAVIGAGGGSVTGDNDQRLDVKAGSVTTTVPVEVRAIAASDLGAALPAGFEFVGAATISFTGTWALPAIWSIPSPSGAADTDLFLLARLQELGGQTRFVLTGTGVLANGRLASETALPGTAVTFEGVRTPGRYVFLRATTPLAFTAGSVTAEGGAAFAGALITSNTIAVVSLSQSTGRYISAVGLGSVTVTALDLQKTDTVSVPVTASTPRQVLPLDLALAARPPTVTSVTPADGAVNIALADPVMVRFSSPIDAATATLQNVRLTSSAGAVVGTLAMTVNNTVATFRSLDPLQPNTAYTLTVSQAVADPFGRSLPAPFVATFTSLDTIAPPPPPAGSITSTIPGTNGKTTITATQGTAGSHDTALIKNLTTGAFTPVVLDSNGGFTAIVAAAVADRLQLIITDAAGNKTVVSLARFRQDNGDGTVSEAVGAEGGRLEGPGGVAIDVPAGAFPTGAVVKYGPVSEAQFPFHLNDAQRQLFQYSGGVRLDLGAAVPQKYLNVSVATTGGEKVTDEWLVMQAIDFASQNSVAAIDTAHVIDGRITTSSPPCPGVTGTGVYGFLKAARPLGVIYGPVTVDRQLPPGVFIPFLVGPGIIGFPTGISDLLVPQIDGSISGQDPLGLGAYISAAGETAAVFSRAPACLPLLSGRATLSQNRFTIATPPGLTVADRELEVVNTTRGATTHFYRPFEPTLSIQGGNADAIIVTAIDAAGNRRTMTPVRQPRTFVHVLIASAEFTSDDTILTIKNTTTGSSPFSTGVSAAPNVPIQDVNVIMEGGAADLYVAEVTNSAGVKRTVNLGVLPYAFGNGNLRLHAVPGTIDPTLAEINAFNATVPPAQQLAPTAAVTKVLLQIDSATSSSSLVIADADAGNTSRLVGGAFDYALDGTFDQKFTLHVIYANGTTADVTVPMFRVTVTNPSTGSVVRTITAPVPPRSEPLPLDLSPPSGPTEVISPPASLVDIDPRSPISIVFSRSLDQASVDANLIVFGTDSNGVLTQIAGTWKLSQGNRVATFIPATALHLNQTYRIALSGVTDLAGQPVAGGSLTVTTFRPRKVGTAALLEPPTGQAVPLKDVSFVRQPGPGNTVATRVIAATANQNGFKVHTIDVTDPRHPAETGHTAGGSYKRRLTMIPKISAPNGVDVMYDVQLIPQDTGMSCWAAGAAMLVGWRDRVSINPKDIAARIGYTAQYDTKGLDGSDTEMFNAWGLVPEPPQTFSVASFKQMLEDFGPLWVASGVPSAHIRVVTGMIGDGTPDGTLVYINDPWQTGMTSFAPPNVGADYAMTYTDFQAQQEFLARQWFGDIAVMQQLCKSGNQKVCTGLNDPPTMQLLKDCSTGNQAACAQLNLPGANQTLVAHLAQKPDWVPPIETGALKIRLPLPGEAPISTCTDHVVPGSGGRQYFNGDLAVTSSWNLDTNYFTFFDVTDPVNPCVIGDKTITANPDTLNSFTSHGTFHLQGSASGVTTLHHADGYAAYMAIAQAGIFAVDIGGSIPSVGQPKDRQQEGIYSGDFVDVLAVRDRVLAVNNNYGGDATLEVLDPNLSPITSITLTNGGATKQHKIVYSAGSWVDTNKNGRVDTGELFDLAYVAGSGGIIVVDVTNLDTPSIVGRITAPGILREISVSDGGRIIFAGGDRGTVATAGGAPVPIAGDAFFMIDASNPFAAAVSDATGRDSRIVFEYGYPDGIGGISVDSQRGLVYIGWPASNVPTGALDIWASDRSARIAFNTPPVANAGPDATVDQDQPITLDGSRSFDADGDPLIYTWTQVGGPAVVLSNPAAPMPIFTSPKIDGAVLTFQLVVNDGVVDSPADTVVITVRPKGHLDLRPVIAPIVVVPGTKQLTVTFTPGNGTATRDVTADTATTYRWLGNGLVSGTDGLPDMTSIVSAIASKLGVPVQIADISVDASGMLTANTPGIQVVRAHYKDGGIDFDSGFTVVLAGIKLKEIALKPESVLTTLAGTLSDALGSKKNPPMILAADANGYVLDKGVVLLDDVTFELLGTATISLKDLVGAIEPLVHDALTAALAETGPAAPVLAHAFTKLAELGVAFAGVQALDPLESADETIASVSQTVPLQGLVQSHVSGLTSISGTLDLGALGKADDSVLVWVLPNVKSATVEPNLTAIRSTDPATPGPTVRTFVEMELIQQAIVPLKGKANTTAELLDRFLPDGMASWQTAIDKDFVTDTPAPKLRFHIKGSMTPTCAPPDASGKVECSITFTDVGLGFYAPNNVRPAINNDYTIADPSIAALGTVETFDTHIVHQNKVGASPLSGNVTVAFMGGAQDTTARIVVTGGGPVLTKTLQDGQDGSVQGGAFVNFTVTVLNPFDTPLQNVQVTDTTYFLARGATTEGVLQSVSLPLIPVLAPHQTVTVDAALTGFVAPGMPGTLRDEVTAVGSAPSSASVVVNIDTLHIAPRLIIAPNAPRTTPLTVTLAHAGGTTEDVTRDPRTTYEWIGKNVPRQVVDAIYQKINAALVAEGQSPLPAQLANVSVDPLTGILTISSNGLQLVRATYNGSLTSEVSVVLAGIQLKSIDLIPLSKLNAIQSALVDLSNPPMVLASDAPGNDAPFDKVGQVLLRDARFEILGGPATISAKKLVDAISSAAGDAMTAFTAETGPLAKVFGWAATQLVTGILDEAGTQLLDPVTSTNTAVATVVNHAGASLPAMPVGRVDALASGLTDIKGTLDLGDYGKASDNVLTWVLPALQSAAIEPAVTIIDLTKSPAPDPKVRTFATLSAGNTGVPLALSGKFKDVAEAIDKFLPGGWTGSGLGTFSLSTGRVHVSAPVDNFQFSFDGTATVACAAPGADESGCSVTVNGLTFGFQVPHQPPVVTDTYVADPSIATTTIDANHFDTHIAAVAVGRSTLESHVDMSTLKMGKTADLNGLVIVTNTQQPVVEKHILGDAFGLVPGSQAQFQILVANPTDTQMDDVQVTDTLQFNGATVGTQQVALGSIPPNEGRRVVLDVVVPATPGVLENDIDFTTCLTHPCDKVVLPVRRPLINELVVEPQRDWDDSGSGGNGVPFDDTPGTGVAPSPSVTLGDQWIEFLTNTGSPDELKNFTLSFTDTSGTAQTVTLSPANLISSAGSPYVLLAAPGSIGRNSVVQLRDTTNTVVDEVDLSAVHAAVGFATGVANEAVARTPDGFDTGAASDFKRKPASIRKLNP